MKKIYIGNAIQGAHTEFLDQIYNLKQLLKKDFELMEYIGLEPNISSESVYLHDEQCVLNCDIFLAICTVPSIGLGQELTLANNVQKPTLLCFQKNTKISRMALGSKIRNKNMRIFEYDTLTDVLEELKKFTN